MAGCCSGSDNESGGRIAATALMVAQEVCGSIDHLPIVQGAVLYTHQRLYIGRIIQE